MSDPQAKLRAHLDTLQAKIQNLLNDFSAGKLNRDQFHQVYEHYNSQIAMVEQALNVGQTQAENPNAPATIAILEAHMGKALGMHIVHAASMRVLETLGEFDPPAKRLSDNLRELRTDWAQRTHLPPRTDKLGFNRWLLFIAGEYSLVGVLFKNEPSSAQMRYLERLLRDFEQANQGALQNVTPDVSNLAYPFVVFVQRGIKRSS